MLAAFDTRTSPSSLQEDHVSLPDRLNKSGRGRRLTIAACAAAALTAGTLAATASTAHAMSTAAPVAKSATPGMSWAITVTGKRVVLPPPKFTPTPIHYEKITHPQLDYMGSTIAAHEHGSHAATIRPASVPQLPGIDISAYQGNIDWSSVAPYIDFVYAKASEGTYYTNPDFYNQYVGPYDAGLIRGAYHFANPADSGGNTQADYFSSHGGGWSGDGQTLPGMLDIEYNPYGSECYDLTQSQMVTWIWNFVNEYAYRWHAYPTIYTTTDWWSTCTGNYGGFGAYDPLFIANYSASGGGPLPNGWGFYTFWQYADQGSLPGDQDVFNGPYTQLQVLATRG
jgi:GH25 family lysozyme M1 (1,4-beta-N-acetylmuramidase)